MAAPRNVGKPHSRAHRRAPSQTARAALVSLPATGCTLPVPAMPKGRVWSLAERARWKELWTSPQAVMWDESATGIVAVLITYEQNIYSGSASAWQAQELRHASEALGLTPRALAMLGWAITDE